MGLKNFPGRRNSQHISSGIKTASYRLPKITGTKYRDGFLLLQKQTIPPFIRVERKSPLELKLKNIRLD